MRRILYGAAGKFPESIGVVLPTLPIVMTMLRRTALLISMLATGPMATAQLALEPVDQGVADADPNAVSLRDMPLDLRAPASFERLYKVPQRDDLLMRVDGGVYAVFPRSLYSRTRLGPVPRIPADTVFHIGHQSVEALAAIEELPATPPGTIQRAETNARPVDRAIVTDLAALPPRNARPNDAGAARTNTVTTPIPATPPPITVATDWRYRSQRIRMLMQKAAAAATR